MRDRIARDKIEIIDDDLKYMRRSDSELFARVAELERLVVDLARALGFKFVEKKTVPAHVEPTNTITTNSWEPG